MKCDGWKAYSCIAVQPPKGKKNVLYGVNKESYFWYSRIGEGKCFITITSQIIGRKQERLLGICSADKGKLYGIFFWGVAPERGIYKFKYPKQLWIMPCEFVLCWIFFLVTYFVILCHLGHDHGLIMKCHRG